MSKSSGDFLRLESLVEEGYDPLAYRFFCLGARYRAKLSFSWESLAGAATALDRLRTAAHAWGAPSEPDNRYVAEFKERIEDDLNMPRVLALCWELVADDLPDAAKKATLLHFDQVMGLGLAEWTPQEEETPDPIRELAAQRQQARDAKDWATADALRDEIAAAGYEIEDTPQGPNIRPRKT